LSSLSLHGALPDGLVTATATHCCVKHATVEGGIQSIQLLFITGRENDGSIAFSIVTKSVNMITHEPLHLA